MTAPSPHLRGRVRGRVKGGLKSRAVTFRVSLQSRGNEGGFDIRILTPGRFCSVKGRAKSKVLTSSLPPGGGANCRAMKA